MITLRLTQWPYTKKLSINFLKEKTANKLIERNRKLISERKLANINVESSITSQKTAIKNVILHSGTLTLEHSHSA